MLPLEIPRSMPCVMWGAANGVLRCLRLRHPCSLFALIILTIMWCI